MEYVLIVAAVYNLIGAFSMWFQPMPEGTSDASMPFDYMQYRIFTGGTAFLFALIYLYVFYVPASAIPLLVFGIALKLWSFIASLISFKKYSFPKEAFLKVGVGNLVFAILFVLYLVTSTDIISQ